VHDAARDVKKAEGDEPAREKKECNREHSVPASIDQVDNNWYTGYYPNGQHGETRSASVAAGPSPERPVIDRNDTLERLYARCEAVAHRRRPDEESAAACRAVLNRLLDNRAVALRRGWRSFAFRREDATGRLYLEGGTPGGLGRAIVPDWIGAPQPERYQQQPDSELVPQ
jgi:hypothetical protein